MSFDLRRATRAVAATFAVATVLNLAAAAQAQSGYFASIAYSQKTGRIGYSARQARTKESADAYAIRMCAAPDAKVFMWARDEWVAIAVVEGQVGNAGFGRGRSANEAQQKALDECAKRAKTHGYRVMLCVHSSGQKVESLRSVAAKPAKSATGFYAALAFSPSTGKIGQTVGKAKTIEEAKELALKDCDAPDAKPFMWGDLWIAIAIAPDKTGVAGFGPGATREAAEKAALEQCTKLAKGSPVRIERAIYSTGETDPKVIPVAAVEPVPQSQPRTPAVPARSRR